MPGTVKQATPVLTITGPRATITGVIFAWPVQCWSCRSWTDLISIGQIVIELHFSASRKTCRWSFRTLGGPTPHLLAECPQCGKADSWVTSDWRWMAGNPNNTKGSEYPHPWPAHRGYPSAMLDGVYATLRATFPRESAKADEAMHAELRRP